MYIEKLRIIAICLSIAMGILFLALVIVIFKKRRPKLQKVDATEHM